MSDHSLRALERRARATGHVDDQAAHLRARVRSGDLTQERLEFAAYCGDTGARLVVWPAMPDWVTPDHVFKGEDRFGRAWENTTLGGWVAGLGAFGSLISATALVRAAVAAARAALVVWEALPTTASYDADMEPVGTYPRRAVQAAETWLACPCASHVTALRRVVAVARHGGRFVPTWALLDSMFTPARDKVSRAEVEAVVLFASGQAGERATRDAIRKSLVSFALGEREGAST